MQDHGCQWQRISDLRPLLFRYAAKLDIALSLRDVTRVKNGKERTLISYLSLLLTTKMHIHKTVITNKLYYFGVIYFSTNPAFATIVQLRSAILNKSMAHELILGS